MKLKTFLTLAGLALLAGSASPLPAQDAAAPARPRLLGIAQLGLFVHDVDRSRLFYKDFLGYDEPFTARNADGNLRLTWIKINDHQFIELFPEKKPDTDRLHQVSLQTDDAEAMRVYLKSKGVTVPEKTSAGQSGTIGFTVKDPDGHTIEFVQFPPDGWIAKDAGQHLPDTRVSLRMPHVGIMVHNLEASEKFYRDILGCTEIWRGSKNGKVLSWANLKLPESRDYLEFMLYDSMPELARINTMHHICLEVASVQQTADLLKGRVMPKESKPATAIATGVNGKRQINYYDPDGTRVEVMEPTTADGKPRPPSNAPPPGS